MNSKNWQIFILFITLLVYLFTFFKLKTNWQLIFIGSAGLATILGYIVKDSIQNIIMNIFIFVLFLIAAIVISFSVAIWINPPITPDGHQVMPLAQLFFSVPVGSIFAIILSFVYFKKLRFAKQLEKHFLLLMTVALSIEFIIDYLS